MVLWIVIGVLLVVLLTIAALRQRRYGRHGDITPTSHIGEGPDRGGMGSGGMG